MTGKGHIKFEIERKKRCIDILKRPKYADKNKKRIESLQKEIIELTNQL